MNNEHMLLQGINYCIETDTDLRTIKNLKFYPGFL